CRVEIGYPVQPAGSTYAYATLAERSGAQIRLGRAATLDMHGERVGGVLIDGQRIEADTVLVAAGPWSPEIVDPSGRWLPIRHRWGVVVETQMATGPSHVLEEADIAAAIGAAPANRSLEFDPDEAIEGFSLVPLAGLASVGSTFLAREPDPAAWIERLLQRASRFVPGVADAPIRGTRVCARPQSLDGRPLVGRVPERPGLFICAGHGAWGISTGPASARLVVDEILGRDPLIPSELDPGRFGPIGA
ncbi:MAG: FAD-binding oxidoreductase, partial [Gemmatimonadales bacterium]